jgi:hypothetical protein
MTDETKRFEEEYFDIVNSIQNKRAAFYRDFELEKPSRQRAIQLLNKLTNKDVTNLRKVTKPT